MLGLVVAAIMAGSFFMPWMSIFGEDMSPYSMIVDKISLTDLPWRGWAFFVYSTVLQSQNIPMVENSRAIAVFSNMTGSIEERDPEAALGWITTQYEQLVGECGEPVEEVEAAPAEN
jgi:hypothetical protein